MPALARRNWYRMLLLSLYPSESIEMNPLHTRSGPGINMIFVALLSFPPAPPSLSLTRGPARSGQAGLGRKDKNPMPPKAAREGSRVKPEMSTMTYHRKAATQIYLSRVAGFFFLSFVRKLRKENPADPVNPVR